MTGRWADEDGSAIAEAAVGLGAVILAWLLIVLIGRVGQAHIEVRSAANAAARAAALAPTAGQARTAARQVAAGDLAEAGLVCQDSHTSVDTSTLTPGGTVTAEVTCTVSLQSLGLLGVGASRTATASSTVPVDTYRGGRP